MPKPDLSVIIVSFNTKAILKDCLDSIIKYTKKINYEVVVVENGSTDGSLEMITEYQKQNAVVKLVNANANIGFGRGNNLGIKHSSGEYLLLLNSDTLLISNSLKESLVRVSNLSNCGIYSCQLLNKDGSIQESGGSFPTLFNLFAWQFGIDDIPFLRNKINSFHPHTSTENPRQKLDWITGAFMVIPRKVFMEAGQFDENIFMYTEEMELAYRIAKLGYKTYYESLSQIIHLGGASGGSYLAITSEVKYMIYFWQKHKPKWQLPIVRLIFFIGSLLRIVLFGIIKKNEKYQKTYRDALKLCF